MGILILQKRSKDGLIVRYRGRKEDFRLRVHSAIFTLRFQSRFMERFCFEGSFVTRPFKDVVRESLRNIDPKSEFFQIRKEITRIFQLAPLNSVVRNYDVWIAHDHASNRPFLVFEVFFTTRISSRTDFLNRFYGSFLFSDDGGVFEKNSCVFQKTVQRYEEEKNRKRNLFFSTE